MKSLNKLLILLMTIFLLFGCEAQEEEEEEVKCDPYTEYCAQQEPDIGVRGQLFYSIKEVLESPELPDFKGYSYDIRNFKVYLIPKFCNNCGAYTIDVDSRGRFEKMNVDPGTYYFVAKYKYSVGSDVLKFYDDDNKEYNIMVLQEVKIRDKMITKLPVFHPLKIYLTEYGCIYDSVEITGKSERQASPWEFDACLDDIARGL